MNSVTLSEAEVGVLMWFAGPDGDGALNRLEVDSRDWGTEVRQCGSASLILRDLLHVGEDGIEVEPHLGGVVVTLTKPQMWLAVAAANDVATDAFQIFVSEEQSILVRRRALSMLEFSGLERGARLGAIVQDAVRGYVDSATPTVVMVRWESTMSTGAWAVGAHGDGTMTVHDLDGNTRGSLDSAALDALVTEILVSLDSAGFTA